MKLLLFAFLLGICDLGTCGPSYQIGQKISSSVLPNYRWFEYVKDNRDGAFGYLVGKDDLVMNVFNCSWGPEFFFSLFTKGCAREINIRPYTRETKNYTPLFVQLDQTQIPNYEDCDPNRVRIVGDVAPDPDNCGGFLQCNNGNLMGRQYCQRSLYFNPNTLKCEFMYVPLANGLVERLSNEEACGDRKLTRELAINTFNLRDRCLDYTGIGRRLFDSFVAVPSNCKNYYRCFTWNLFSKDRTLSFECPKNGDVQTYWANGNQTCLEQNALQEDDKNYCGLDL